MKTLVVFLTLWSTCFSKPSTLEDETLLFEPTEKNQDFIVRTNLQDEKTAILENTHDEHPGDTQLSQQSLSGSPSQERSIFVSKKPVLIKKGYHIYRTADEEQAPNDPKQRCNKQVKVNICEEDTETNSNQMRFDSTFLRSHDNMTKDEMKKTIKMVKEVVKHMQNDLQTLEVTSTDLLTEEQLQSGQTKTQLHDDFMLLHTVLDDLDKHIGHSTESPSLHSQKEDNKNTSNENTEESRMMQWKDTFKTIQENSGRNIEDRFVTERINIDNEKIAKDVNEEIEKDHLQSSSHDTVVENADKITSHIQTLETMSKHNEDPEMSITQDINGKGTLQSDSLRLEQALASAPQAREEELLSKSDNMLIETDHNNLQKHSEFKAQSSEIQDIINSNVKDTHEKMKTMKQEDNTMMRVDTIETLQEHMQDKHEFTNMVKRKSDDDAMEHNFNSDQVDEHHMNNPQFKSKDDSQASGSTTTEDHSNTNKKHENINEQTQHSHLAKQTTNDMEAGSFDSHSSIIPPPREASHSTEVQTERNNPFHSQMNGENTGVSHQLSHLPNTRLALDHNNNQVLRAMSSNDVKGQHEASQRLFNDHSQSVTGGKANNDVGKMDEALQHQFNGQQNTRWAQVRGMDTSMSDAHKTDNKNQEGKSGIHLHDSMRKNDQDIADQGQHMHRLHESSKHEHSGRMPVEEHFINTPSLSTSHPNFPSPNGETHSLRNHDSQLSNRRFAHDFYTMPAMRANMGFVDNSKMTMQSQQHSLNMPHGHHFSSGMTHGQAMFHNEKITESDSMVQASEHMGMREAMMRSAGEYPQQYYNNDGNNKGSGYHQEQPRMHPATSSGSGAVGMFPDANVGGCAIPLLLSCSPSVVTGTLAKGQPSYTAPSYRSTDAYRYHKKRETKNSNSKHDIKTIPKIMFKGKIESAANVIN